MFRDDSSKENSGSRIANAQQGPRHLPPEACQPQVAAKFQINAPSNHNPSGPAVAAAGLAADGVQTCGNVSMHKGAPQRDAQMQQYSQRGGGNQMISSVASRHDDCRPAGPTAQTGTSVMPASISDPAVQKQVLQPSSTHPTNPSTDNGRIANARLLMPQIAGPATKSGISPQVVANFQQNAVCQGHLSHAAWNPAFHPRPMQPDSASHVFNATGPGRFQMPHSRVSGAFSHKCHCSHQHWQPF